jgi:hypothetical protein
VQTELVEFEVAHNNMTGRIPDCIGSLKKLVVLQLAYNSFTGALDRVLFLLCLIACFVL